MVWSISPSQAKLAIASPALQGGVIDSAVLADLGLGDFIGGLDIGDPALLDGFVCRGLDPVQGLFIVQVINIVGGLTSSPPLRAGIPARLGRL